MFTINYDIQANRIIVKVKEINMSNARQYVEEFTKVLEQVKPGFTGITDLSESKLLTQEVAQELAPTSQLAVEKGVSTSKKWGYVTGSSIYKMQMKRMFGDFVEYFDSIEAANAYLNS